MSSTNPVQGDGFLRQHGGPFCVSRQKRFAFRLFWVAVSTRSLRSLSPTAGRSLRLYSEARVRYSRGRAFGARAFPAPFGLGARYGGRSRGPYTSDHMSHSHSLLVLHTAAALGIATIREAIGGHHGTS